MAVSQSLQRFCRSSSDPIPQIVLVRSTALCKSALLLIPATDTKAWQGEFVTIFRVVTLLTPPYGGVVQWVVGANHISNVYRSGH